MGSPPALRCDPIVSNTKGVTKLVTLAHSTLAIEDRLVLLLSQVQLDGNIRRRAYDLLSGGPFDWSYAVETADFQKTLSMFARGIDVLRAEYGKLGGVSDDAINNLHCLAVDRRTRTERQFQELGKILGLLTAHNVLPLVLKGPALEASVYQNTRTRTFDDFDLWVHTDDMDIVHTLLIDQGFRQGSFERSGRFIPMDARLDHARRVRWRHRSPYVKLVNLGKQDIVLDVEVHGPVNDDTFFGFDTSRFAERAIDVDLDGTPSRMLSPVDSIIHLSAHLYKHLYEVPSGTNFGALHLINFCDVHETFRQYPEMELWRYLYRDADELGCANATFFTLVHTDHLFPGCVPPELLDPPAVLTQAPEVVIDDRWEFVGGESCLIERLFHPSADIERVARLKASGVVGGKVEIPYVQKAPHFTDNTSPIDRVKSAFIQINPSACPPWQYFRTHLAFGKLNGEEDLSASVWLSWCARELLVGADVRDDIVVLNEWWGFYQLQDSVQILVESPVGSGHLTNILLVLGGADLARPAVFELNPRHQKGTFPVPGAQIVGAQHKSGYRLEAAIPFAALGIDPHSHTPFGFDIVINDVDNPNGQRKASLVWSGGRNALRNPAVFGVATLSGPGR